MAYNMLHYSITGLMYLLWTKENAATWLAPGTRQCDSTSPVLHRLNWLPVGQRMELKVAITGHQAMLGHTSCYLAVNCYY